MIILTRDNVAFNDGQWRYLEVSALPGTYTINTSGTGDIDLYTSSSMRVNENDYDYGSWNTGSTETCQIILTENGTIYIGLHGYEAGTISVSIDGPDQTLGIITDVDYIEPDCNCVVDWGDATSNTFEYYSDPAWNHVYATAGNYDIKITGTCDAPNFQQHQFSSDTVIDIKKWGKLIGASDWSHAFYNCYNLECSATDDFGEGVTNSSSMFEFCSLFNGVVDHWDVSKVRNFSYMFSTCEVFNSPINSWNVSNGVFFQDMFHGAKLFNQPLNSWDTSNATNMSYMFTGCLNFNQNINSWNVVHVTDINNAFDNCPLFNSPLNNWNVISVSNMNSLFNNSIAFNQNISCWYTAQIPTEPVNFKTNSPLLSENTPQWGVESPCGVVMPKLNLSFLVNSSQFPTGWKYITHDNLVGIDVIESQIFTDIPTPFSQPNGNRRYGAYSQSHSGWWISGVNADYTSISGIATFGGGYTLITGYNLCQFTQSETHSVAHPITGATFAVPHGQSINSDPPIILYPNGTTESLPTYSTPAMGGCWNSDGTKLAVLYRSVYSNYEHQYRIRIYNVSDSSLLQDIRFGLNADFPDLRQFIWSSNDRYIACRINAHVRVLDLVATASLEWGRPEIANRSVAVMYASLTGIGMFNYNSSLYVDGYFESANTPKVYRIGNKNSLMPEDEGYWYSNQVHRQDNYRPNRLNFIASSQNILIATVSWDAPVSRELFIYNSSTGAKVHQYKAQDNSDFVDVNAILALPTKLTF